MLFNYASKAGSGFDFVKPIIENSVLCYISTQPQTGTALDGNAVGAIIDHFQSDPMNFLKLSGLKFLCFLGPYEAVLFHVSQLVAEGLLLSALFFCFRRNCQLRKQ
jgi:hypothetical protein